MEACFASMFRDVRHERSSLFSLSLTDPDIKKRSKFRDHEIIIIKYLALEKIHRKKILREAVAVSLLEY